MPKDPDNLGPEAEGAVREALDELVKENSIFQTYIKAKNSDRLDAEGIDFLIILRGGMALPLQVKSSYRNIHRFHAVHPNIRWVLILKKEIKGISALDKNLSLYRGTLNYVKRQLKNYVRRAMRDLAANQP